MKKIYIEELEKLKLYAESIPDTRMMALAKINALITMNMRYEKLMVNRNLNTHPYVLTKKIVQDTFVMLNAWSETLFIESDEKDLTGKNAQMERRHQELFQDLWVNFSPEEYKKERIDKYTHRLKINGLGNNWLKGKKCIDFGCGHGNFAQALLEEGCESVYGIDYGENSIEYAKESQKVFGIPAEKLEFNVGSVYKISKPDETFDFAIQNGVFHHLNDEDTAYQEVYRILKKGGSFWIYTDGCGAISHDLWDASIHILRNIHHSLVIQYLQYLNISTNKRYHLGDGLNAVYRHTSYEALTDRLSKMGFGNFRRLTGGFPTDFDHDAIAGDKYGIEKFGSGDIRILAQKL